MPPAPNPLRLGIFGGSFDPVHNGHLALARACQAQAALDEVWFTPSAIQPLKRGGPRATDAQRVAMLTLAIDNDPGKPGEPSPRAAWRVCTLEIDRGGMSYTVDTLRQVRAERPDARMFFLVGADAVRDLALWKEPAGIVGLATPLVVHRAGEPAADLTLLAKLCPEEHAPRVIEMSPVDVSSTEVRRRIAAGEPIEELVPPAVARYIYDHRIYR